jgi:glycerophosphoryl diester phosphodiesterase/glyoxylase-like metal-dependent hydrolase (beta-lactamase superfamily II)
MRIKKIKGLTKVKPFRMIGNIYFVGTVEASSHLIDTGAGLILIDTGYAENAPLIVESMQMLGFDIKDVKIILHSHGHYDHTDATGALLRLVPTAKTYLSFHDIRYIEDFSPDFDIQDGDVIELGNTKIECWFTPGHTEGSVSFFLDVEENGQVYKAAMFGGSGVNQLKKAFMDNWEVPYLCRGLFFDSIDRLLQRKVDVMIGNHSWQNHTLEKYERMKDALINPFIDPLEWTAYLTVLRDKLSKIIIDDSRNHFVQYAHRGASEYCPENTMSAFSEAVRMGANGIETDIQKTKDGVLVLFHDDTLERATGEKGSVCEYTYEQLQGFCVKKGELCDKIPTLDAFLQRFANEELSFALELKVDGVEKEVVDLSYRYGVEKRTVITSFKIARLQVVKEYAPHMRVGYLTKTAGDDVVRSLIEMGADEICPRASLVTAESVKTWHRIGLNVRAWGVENEECMQAVYDAGADGMTFNAPDVIYAYIERKNAEKEQ